MMAQALAQPAADSFYFRNPLAIPIELTANFGELRNDHWHMGLDIRTNAKENIPVYAAARGYIAQIGVRPQSFGRFIVINHPNGLSTLYAHLNDFFPALEDYVTHKQYEKESWAIELEFRPEQFPVSKGTFIAYSGNTGGSRGPHLHFEVFETSTGKRLNPLLHLFPLKDDISPVLQRLAMYDRSKSVFDQSPLMFTLKNTDSGYIIPRMPVVKTGYARLSFALQAYDLIRKGGSEDGIYSASIRVNDEELLYFRLDSIDYDETSYINSHIDYTHRHGGGSWLQHLSQLPGNRSQVYRQVKNDAVLELADTLPHKIHILVHDSRGNSSALQFYIRYDSSLARSRVNYKPPYSFAPNSVSLLERPGFQLFIPQYALYDTVSAAYSLLETVNPLTFSRIHQTSPVHIPFHQDAVVRVQVNRKPPEHLMNKLLLLRTSGSRNTVRKAVLQEQWAVASFDGFGTFRVVADTLAPKINDPLKTSRPAKPGDTLDLSPLNRIIFTPVDEYRVQKFSAWLNGKWIRFTNDKSSHWVYRFDERCPYGVHELRVRAEDMAGNSTEKTWWIKRGPYTPPPPKKKTQKKGAVKKKPATKKK